MSDPRPTKLPPTGHFQTSTRPPPSRVTGIAIVGDTTTTTGYITVGQATCAVRRDIAKEAGADGGPPFDRGATLDTGGGASCRNVTAVNDHTGETATIKHVTDDARRSARGKELEIHADSRVAAAATTDSVADARRE